MMMGLARERRPRSLTRIKRDGDVNEAERDADDVNEVNGDERDANERGERGE